MQSNRTPHGSRCLVLAYTKHASSRRKNVIAISLPVRGQSTDSQRTVERDLTENVTFPRKKSVQEPDLSAQGESSTAQERDQNIRLTYS
jgi:hypothetical protein